MEYIGLLSIVNLPANIIILVLVIVNHLRLKDVCQGMKAAHGRIDEHLKNHG